MLCKLLRLANSTWEMAKKLEKILGSAMDKVNFSK
jgi:hypothetical protein